MSLSSRLGGAFGRILRDVLNSALKSSSRSTTRRRTTSTRTSPPLSRDYPGDYTKKPSISYDPHPGTLPDPGEIVWTWVVFEEDHSQGKDRPVLIIGRDGDWMLACPLTSKDHDRDAAQEAHEGRYWVEIGTGSWDPQRRVSEVRVDRIVRVDPREVRRVAGKLDKTRFDKVADGVRRHWDD